LVVGPEAAAGADPSPLGFGKPQHKEFGMARFLFEPIFWLGEKLLPQKTMWQ
jgi:hypothetical protein